MEMEIVPGKGNHERYISNIYVLLISISVKITNFGTSYGEYIEYTLYIYHTVLRALKFFLKSRMFETYWGGF